MINPAHAAAPGKLFIAGEYAIVTPGEPAILVALDRLLSVRLTPRTEPGVMVNSAAYATARHWHLGEAGTDYVTSALATIEALRAGRGLAPAGYTLDITSQLDAGDRKLGLGSSGAVTVATTKAIARAYGLRLTRIELFRLALIAAIAISPRGSGGDIAASTFGGWIRYTSPDRAAIAESVARRGVTATASDDAVWAGCEITALPAPPLPLLVGWVGHPASTDTLVARAQCTTVDPGFLAASRAVVDAVTHALRRGDAGALLTAISTARDVLATFAAAQATTIETRDLAVLADIASANGGAGKSSGAGGGDCGIAFAPEAAAAKRILKQWAASGITPLDVATYDIEGDTP